MPNDKSLGSKKTMGGGIFQSNIIINFTEIGFDVKDITVENGLHLLMEKLDRLP